MDEPRGDRVIRVMPVVLLCGALGWIVGKAASPVADPDDWWHLRLGNDLIAQGSLATPDHWSSFATVSWVPTEPLPEIVSAVVNRWFGLPGLAFVFGLFVLLVVASVYVANRREADVLPAVFATVLLLLPAYGALTSRPQLVSFALLPVVLAAWLRTEHDLRPRWWLVPLIWFWSLCHGFWFIGAAYGFLFVGAIAVSRRAGPRDLLRIAGVAVVSFAVVVVNPVGIGVFEAPFAVRGAATYIAEWQHPSLLTPGPLGALIMVGITALIWIRARKRVTVGRALLLLSAVFWIWYAERTVILGAIVCAPLLAGALQTLVVRDASTPPDTLRAGSIEARAVTCWSALCLVVLALVVPHTSAQPGDVPVGLDSTLDRIPAGTPIFNDYAYGGWLSWRHPGLERYIDGLATPYSPAQDEAFHVAETLQPGWYAAVRASRAPVAVLMTTSALAEALEKRGWRVSGKDAGYVLLHRPGG